jgi:uncharacterized membrane protein YkoI
MRRRIVRNLLYFLALGLLVAVGCETNQGAASVDTDDTKRVATDDKAETAEMVIALDMVPAKVMSAGEKAVPGIVFTRVERELENGVWVYDMEGTAKGVRYEIEVTADGKVLEIEEEDDDEGDDDDDDDDEHEDDDDD